MVSTSQATGAQHRYKVSSFFCCSVEVPQGWLDVHLKLSVLTSGCLAMTVVGFDAVVDLVPPVLGQDVEAGHPGNDGQVSRGGLGDGGVTPVQQEFTVVDDPGPSRSGRK